MSIGARRVLTTGGILTIWALAAVFGQIIADHL